MAIRDIFKMIKADRYTQDGREELIKAQEAVTEDVRYKPGDISKATGLQKQPDGSWKPVKNASAQSKKSDKTTPEEMSKIKTLSAQYKNAKTDAEKDRIANEVNKIMGVEGKKKAEQSAPGWRAPGSESDPNTEGSIAWYAQQAKKSPSASGSGVPIQGSNWMSLPSGTRMTFEGAKEKMAQNSQRIEALKKSMEGKSFADNFRAGIELKKLENENEYIAERLPREMRETPSATGSAPSAPKFETEQENAKYEEGLKGWDNVNPDRLPDIKKKVEQKIDYYKKYDSYAMLGKKTGLSAAQKSAVQQNMAQAKENLAFYTGQLEGINKKMGGGSNDSAPRILTGDCKIRIKKSK